MKNKDVVLRVLIIFIFIASTFLLTLSIVAPSEEGNYSNLIMGTSLLAVATSLLSVSISSKNKKDETKKEDNKEEE